MEITDDEKIKYAREFAETINLQVTELIDEETKCNGPEVSNMIIFNVLRSFTKSLVHRSLAMQSKSADEKVNEYGKVKHLIQESIAEGFCNAFYAFTKDKDPTDFICRINAIDESRRKGTA